VQRTARALDPPGNARDDWQILVALSQLLGALPGPEGDVGEQLAPPSCFALPPNRPSAVGLERAYIRDFLPVS